MPAGEEEEQDIEILSEQIMNENFLNLVKEIDFQNVQEAQRLPKKLDSRRNTPRYIILKSYPRLQVRRESEKQQEERRVPKRLSADFSKETLQARRG